MTPHGTPLASWLDVTDSLGATDLHLSVGLPPTVRVAGGLRALEGCAPLDDAQLEALAVEVLGERAGLLTDQGDVDFSFGWRDESRFRGNAFRQRGRLAIALRRIPLRIPTPTELGLPPVLDRFLDAASGLPRPRPRAGPREPAGGGLRPGDLRRGPARRPAGGPDVLLVGECATWKDSPRFAPTVAGRPDLREGLLASGRSGYWPRWNDARYGTPRGRGDCGTAGCRAARQTLGELPFERLNARLKASSES